MRFFGEPDRRYYDKLRVSLFGCVLSNGIFVLDEAGAVATCNEKENWKVVETMVFFTISTIKGMDTDQLHYFYQGADERILVEENAIFFDPGPTGCENKDIQEKNRVYMEKD